jgi:surface carbohydrate biosynthesis protein
MSRLAANPILYVPVESRDREFDARLLVAFAAAERGLLVAFGQQTALFGNLHRLPPGILLLKGLNRVQRRVVELAGEFGHVVVASDEEAVGLSDPDYMLKDIDPGISGGLVAVYAQGEAQARMLVERRGFGPDQVQVTGNPRIGLLRAPFLDMYCEEAAGLRERFGPFVLANTNICAVNTSWGSLERYLQLCVEIGWLDPANPAERALWDAHVAHDHASYRAMTEFLDAAPGALPGHDVVVRPHPSERIEPWQERYGERPRFHVLREGSLVAWLLAADLIVHTSCTTGVEAAFIGRPALSILPPDAPVGHWYLSNQVNPTTPSAAAAIGLASRFLVDGTDVFAEGRATRERLLIKHHVAQGDQFAFDAMASHMAGTLVDQDSLHQPHRWRPVGVRPDQQRSERDRVKVEISKDDVLARQRRFGGLLGRFGDLQVRPLWESLFMIHAPGRLIIER